MIKVSVIIPVYKVRQDYLRACLSSLVAQAMQEIEFILVSDGAPEIEKNICNEYVAADSRFIFFDQKHTGVSPTRNFGISHARGEYITFVDCDDWVEKEAFVSLYNFAKENNSDIVFWNLFFFEDDIKQSATSFSSKRIDNLSEEEQELYKKKIIHPSKKELLIPALTVCKLIRRECISKNNIQFDEDLNYGEDRVFNFRLAEACKIISYYNIPLYYYRIHNQSATFSFQENYLNNTIKYICKLEEITNGAYNEQLGNDLWIGYQISWQRCFFHPSNKKTFFDKISILKSTISSPVFQSIIKHAGHNNDNLIAKLELSCLKHKMYTIIWLHGLAKLILSHFHLRKRQFD